MASGDVGRLMNETCTDCGARAICRYDYGAGMRYACAAHDPLRPLIAATVHVPPFYQSLPWFPLSVTSGMVPRQPPAPSTRPRGRW
jgi:hypothetical protein